MNHPEGSIGLSSHVPAVAHTDVPTLARHRFAARTLPFSLSRAAGFSPRGLAPSTEPKTAKDSTDENATRSSRDTTALPTGTTLLICLLPLAALVGCGESFTFDTPDPAVRFVAFGDSSTAGPSERDYVDFLPGLLAQETEAFANRGLGGETTDEGLIRLRRLLTDDIFPNATVLMYWEGGNDLNDFLGERDPLLLSSPDSPDFPFANSLASTLATVQANVEAAIAAARDARLDVFVATYFPLAPGMSECDPLLLGVLGPDQAANGNAYIDRLNESLRLAAANAGAAVVDIATSGFIFQADPANYFNCNHLSAMGNEIAAARFATAIGSR